MQIDIGATNLIPGGQASVSDLQILTEDLTQSLEALRADVVAGVVNRGNAVNVLTFGFTREHADWMTAESFMLTHKTSLPKTGTITFTCQNSDGTTTVLTMVNGTLHKAQGRQIGCATIWQYTISGGLIS